MTVSQAIAALDEGKPNAFSTAQKTDWLWEAEGLVCDEILGWPALPRAQVSAETELSAEAPYAGLYLKYAEAQMDYYQGDFARCNNAMNLFYTLFSGYGAYIRRRSAPEQEIKVAF